ncbi:MAG: extracellular solute-binding protein family 3 [Acidimicrobiales bacterium]|nr:extracellular solute-binding protein family 3 [Acidimicrobiales bacterium]
MFGPLAHGTSRRRAAAVVACSAVLLLAACGKSSKSSTATTAATATTAPAKSSGLAAQVPAKLSKAGTLVVAADASYAPNEFFASDNKTVQGMDVDLANAIASKLGLKADVKNAGFDTIIPSLGNRYDIGMSSFTDNKKREAQVDFVDYYSAGTGFYVEKGKNQTLDTLDALCGHTVGVEKGTTQLDDATAQGKKCTTAGKKTVTVLAFPDQNGANLALSSGRVDVVMADSPVAAYGAKQSNGKFELIGKAYGTAPYGIAIPKSADYKGLTTAIQGALQEMEKDGSYVAILKKWGVEAGAVTTFTINGATS